MPEGDHNIMFNANELHVHRLRQKELERQAQRERLKQVALNRENNSKSQRRWVRFLSLFF
jgi:hypothetical protein